MSDKNDGSADKGHNSGELNSPSAVLGKITEGLGDSLGKIWDGLGDSAPKIAEGVRDIPVSRIVRDVENLPESVAQNLDNNTAGGQISGAFVGVAKLLWEAGRDTASLGYNFASAGLSGVRTIYDISPLGCQLLCRGRRH